MAGTKTKPQLRLAGRAAIALGIVAGVAALGRPLKSCLGVEPGFISAGAAVCALWIALSWRAQLVEGRRLDAIQGYWAAVQLLKRQLAAFEQTAARLHQRADEQTILGPDACRTFQEAGRDLDARWQALVQANARAWPHDPKAETCVDALATLYERLDAWRADIVSLNVGPREECEPAGALLQRVKTEELRLRPLIRQDFHSSA